MRTHLIFPFLLLLTSVIAQDDPLPSVSLPWRHADPRLTLGRNPSLLSVRADSLNTPPGPASDDEATLIRMTQQTPDNLQAQLLLADLELARGERARAAERFLFVSLRDGSNIPALSGLSASLLADDSLAPAAKLLSEMDRQGMLTGRDALNLAWVHYRQRRFPEAHALLEREEKRHTASQNPSPSLLENIRYNKAVVLLSQGETEAALDALKESPASQN
jgi:tetratricopeptide (TPR) repeat protein